MKDFRNKALEKLELLDSKEQRKLFSDVLDELELKEAVLDSLNEGIILLNAKGNAVYINSTLSRIVPLMPYATKKYFGKPVEAVVRDNDIASFLKSRKKHEEDSCEFAFDNGKVVEVSVFPDYAEYRGEKCTLVKIADITSLRRNQAKSRRNESLAQMTTMAAGLVHDIKNPLGGMSIYLQLLQRKLDKNGSVSKEEAEESLSVISEEITRLNALINEFLYAVSPMSCNPVLCDAAELLQSVAEFVKPELDEKHIRLEVVIESHLPKVMIDPSLFRRAALNLIHNSIHAIEAVELREDPAIVLRAGRNGNSVEVHFCDNGCGIKDEILPKIFEPYYTTKAKGSGLGLTTLAKIVREHNAELNVNTKENEGTAFIISFPVPREQWYKLEEKA